MSALRCSAHSDSRGDGSLFGAIEKGRRLSEVWQNIRLGLTTASPLDQANLALGLVGVWLMIRRSLWAFPVGLVAVTVQGVLFYQINFPADAALQRQFAVNAVGRLQLPAVVHAYNQGKRAMP